MEDREGGRGGSRARGCWGRLLILAAALCSLGPMAASARSAHGYDLFPPTMALRRVEKVEKPKVTLFSIHRGEYDEKNPGMSCADAGLIIFSLSKSPDIGYSFKVVSGNLDPYTFPEEIVRAPENSPGKVMFPWLDWPRRPSGTIDAVVEVTAYDRWMNASQPIRLHIVEGQHE